MMLRRHSSHLSAGAGGSAARIHSCSSRVVSFLLGVIVAAAGAARAWAQNPTAAESPNNSAAPSSAAVVSWDNGLHLHPRSGKAQLEIGGEVQLDERLFGGSPKPQGVTPFILRRGRLVVLGSAFKRLDFQVMAESPKSGPFILRDAYVDFEISERMRLRAGKTKSGVGLERNQSNRYQMFAERALPANLTPGRDVGIQLYGDFAGGKVTYMGGLVRGVPDGDCINYAPNHGADLDYHIFAYPFHHSREPFLTGFGLGIGGSAGTERDSTPVFTTAGLAQFFHYRPGALADGERTRISPQADYYWGRLGVIAEYVASAQDVRLGAVIRRVDNTAWQASGVFVLTGENASYLGVTPAHAFDPALRHWGAFEVAGRFNTLEIGPSAFPALADPGTAARKASGFQVGLNWYPQEYVKAVFNYAQTRFVGGAAAGNRPTENAFILRLQFSFY